MSLTIIPDRTTRIAPRIAAIAAMILTSGRPFTVVGPGNPVGTEGVVVGLDCLRDTDEIASVCVTDNIIVGNAIVLDVIPVLLYSKDVEVLFPPAVDGVKREEDMITVVVHDEAVSVRLRETWIVVLPFCAPVGEGDLNELGEGVMILVACVP